MRAHITVKGDYRKAHNFFEQLLENVDLGVLNKYGKRGVDALIEATPRDTGETAESWSYQITREKGRIKLEFLNSHVENYVNIALILQYGHATRNGGYVQGIDYINPALHDVFDELADEAWKEMVNSGNNR